MGLEIESIELLIKSKRLDVKFDRTLTIGRQRMLVKENVLQKILLKNGFIKSHADFKLDRYAESFFKLLGARQISSLDASDYEGSEIIHDLNNPIADSYKSKFDLVFDGGSLEHIFNFPVAIKNCMDLIEIGGHYVSLTPANNFMGHGFYQFSPELYFRVFNPTNGFKLKKMFFYTRKKGGKFYEVTDPSIVNQRVGMVNSYPSLLFIIAEKIENVEVFSQTPQQYDYQNILWKRPPQQKKNTRVHYKFLRKFVPKGMKSKVKKGWKRFRNRFQTFWRETGTGNPNHFKS